MRLVRKVVRMLPRPIAYMIKQSSLYNVRLRVKIIETL